MGGSSSSSSVTHKINTTIINKNTFDAVNKSLTSIAVSAVVNNAKSCSSSTNLNQDINAQYTRSKCLNITGVTMDQTSHIDLTCVQPSQVRMDMMNKMTDSIVSQMKARMKSSVFAKVLTMSTSAAHTGAISMPFGKGAKSSTKVKLIKNTTIDNSMDVHLKNVIRTCVHQSFTTNNIMKCSSHIVQNQDIDVQGAQAAQCINIANIHMDQATSIVTKCIQTSKTVNDVINNVAHNTGLAIASTASTKSVTHVTTIAKSKAKQTGVIGAIGSVFSGLLAGLLPIILIVACVLVVVVFVAPKLLGGDDDEEGEEGEEGGAD
jgi:hypothetical protein